MRPGSCAITVWLAALATLIVVAAMTTLPAARVAHGGSQPLALASAGGLPSHDAPPATTPGLGESEDDPEPLACGWHFAGRSGAPASTTAGPVRLPHAPFAAPRSLPLRA